MSSIKSVQSFQVEIEVDGALKTKTFGTEREARIALASAEVTPAIEAYLDNKGLEGRQRAAQFTVLVEYEAAKVVDAQLESEAEADGSF